MQNRIYRTRSFCFILIVFVVSFVFLTPFAFTDDGLDLDEEVLSTEEASSENDLDIGLEPEETTQEMVVVDEVLESPEGEIVEDDEIGVVVLEEDAGSGTEDGEFYVGLEEIIVETQEEAQDQSDSIELIEENISEENLQQNGSLNQTGLIENKAESEKIYENTDKALIQPEEEGGANRRDKKTYEYLDIEEIVEEKEMDNGSEEPSESIEEEKSEITFVYYKGNKKEMETKLEEGEEIEIKKEEVLEEKGDWKKNVKIYSEEHFEKPVTVYSDISETELENIRIYWKEEESFVDFQTYDEDQNGLIERVSWIVPHLSEQNFEIIIDFNLAEVQGENEILIDVSEAPNSSVTDPLASFDFSISYYDVNSVSCNFSLKNIEGIVESMQNLGADLEFDLYIENGAHIWNLDCFDVNNLSVSSSANGTFSKQVDYTPEIEFSVSGTTINEGEGVEFTINISTIIDSDISYVLYTGDGPTSFGNILENNHVSNLFERFNYVYQNPGQYDVNLQVRINDVDSIESYQIDVNSLAQGDNENPSVTLIYPEEDERINNEEIVFVYKAEDNAQIDNCTLSLYYYNDSIFGSLVYETTKEDVVNGDEVEIELVDFDEGDYSWDVGCYDNSSNHREKDRDFEIDFSEFNSLINQNENTETDELDYSFEEAEEVEELISAINNFLVAEEKYSQEQMEAIEDLKIIENLKFYKKKLLQMKLDLGHNLDYVRGDNKREEREAEILEEIEKIRKEVPIRLEVIESHEYFKSSLEFNTEEVIRAYVDSKGFVIDESGIKRMAKENEKIQNYIAVTTAAKQLEIEYLDFSKEITSVSKKIDFKNRSFDSLMEVVPKEVADSAEDITFINDYEIIKEDPIFEVKLENLDEDKFVYYFDGLIGLNEVEKTTTLSFIEEIPQARLGAISGFVTLIGGDESKNIWFYLSWVIVAIGAILIALAVPRKMRLKRWKREKETGRLFDIVLETKKALKQGDLVKAKEKYKEASEIYPAVPEKCKKHIYKKITGLQVEIDKKDARALIEEFMAAAKENRKEDALIVYDNISNIYNRMPRKYKRKVYNKIIPLANSFRNN